MTRPELVLIVPPWPACVSRSYSSQTRSRSGSAPFGWISTSQSIAHPLGLGQQTIQRRAIAGFQSALKLRQAAAEQPQRVQHGGAVVGEDGGPQSRVAGGDARRVAKAARSELVQFRREDPRQRCGEQMGQMTRQRQ